MFRITFVASSAAPFNLKENPMSLRVLATAAAILLVTACSGSRIVERATDPASEAELIRTTESRRLLALVEGDVDAARSLHADDFQLINPRGESVSKEQYLGGIASGQLDYLVWEPESSIDVRVHGGGAVIRYQSRLEIIVDGENVPLLRYWHTDSYEKRNGSWQVVWSHATLIQ